MGSCEFESHRGRTLLLFRQFPAYLYLTTFDAGSYDSLGDMIFGVPFSEHILPSPVRYRQLRPFKFPSLNVRPTDLESGFVEADIVDFGIVMQLSGYGDRKGKFVLALLLGVLLARHDLTISGVIIGGPCQEHLVHIPQLRPRKTQLLVGWEC